MPKFPKIPRPPKGGAGIDEIIAQVEKALGSYSKRPIKAVRDLLIKQGQENPAPLELEPGTQSVFLNLLQSALESLRKNVPYVGEHAQAPRKRMDRLDTTLFQAQEKSRLKGRTSLPSEAANQEAQLRTFESGPRANPRYPPSQIEPPPIPPPIRARRPGVEISRPFPAEGPAELYMGGERIPSDVSMQEAMQALDEMRTQKRRTKVGSREVRRAARRNPPIVREFPSIEYPPPTLADVDPETLRRFGEPQWP